MMRIITGSARGTHLETLAGDATRPTSERAKEAIFSMLQFEIAGARVLDLFAGSGQLGLEAISRGATNAVFVDASRAACEIVRRNVERTHAASRATVVPADALSFLNTTQEKPFSLVLLDPPYAAGLIAPALSLLLSRSLLLPGATVVCESGAREDVFRGDAALSGAFDVVKESKYGVAYVTILKKREEREV